LLLPIHDYALIADNRGGRQVKAEGDSGTAACQGKDAGWRNWSARRALLLIAVFFLV